MPSKRIAFIRPASVPYANVTVANLIENLFPEYEVDIFDLVELLKGQKRSVLLANAFFTLGEYGQDVALGRKRAVSAFFTTTYLFRAVKKMMAELISPDKYLFSFQMQSLFDASVDGLPHFVYTDHTMLANRQYPDVDLVRVLPRQAWIDLERDIYANAARVFTRSSNIAESVINDYSIDRGQVDCVYIGPNAEIVPSTVESDHYADRHILFVGIDWDRKGGPDLVQAFERILSVYPETRLTIAGASPEVNLPNCEVVGRVPLNQIACYFRDSSIFCLPTRLEPFGVVFIEALNSGLPLVATKVGAIPDFIVEGENGYMVAPRNVEQLTEALLKLLSDPEQCRLFGNASFTLAQERYTWKSVGARMKAHILLVLDGEL